VRFRKIEANKYEVSVDNRNKHVTYGFIKDLNDDFIKLGKGSVGNVNGEDLLMSESYAENLTGTWSTSSPPHYYTTQVGATFSATATGDKIVFRHRSDNCGGIWGFIVDGSTANKVSISTWAEIDSTASATESVIFTGLENKLYTIVGMFKEVDPNQAPNDGTARGWVWCKTTDPLHKTMRGYVEGGNLQYTAQLLDEYSNKEIIFNLGYGSKNKWIPEHDAISLAFNKVNPKFLMDDVEIDVSALALYEWVEGTNFRLVQNNYIRTSESGVTNLAE